MKIIKKINNNVVLGLDGSHREVILFGKGLGFEQIPYELTDLSKIDRTYYDIDERYYSLIGEIDSSLISYIDGMMDIIKAKNPGNWNPSITFIIADHINFCLQRMRAGFKVDFPYSYEIECEFPEYNKMAKWMVQNINKKMKVHLEKGEITCLAMHLINAVEGVKKSEVETVAEKTARILKTVTSIIENYFQTEINRNDINYFRFRYHIQYLVKRKELHTEFQDDNSKLLEDMKNSYPETYGCALEIEKYLNQIYVEPCSKDELLYLMVHINRLYFKEDCNRKGITPKK